MLPIVHGDAVSLIASKRIPLYRPTPASFSSRRPATTGITVLLLSVMLVTTALAAEAPVFKDKHLENAVRKFVFDKRDNQQPLTESDLLNLSTIQAAGQGITDLTGLDKCPNLASLDLSGNKVSNLGPLANLTRLEYLNLASNQIADLKPLAGLAGLQYLELSHNRVKDLGPLVTLTNLASLYLSDNRVGDLAPLLKLPRLTTLYLDHNQIKSIQGINVLTNLSSLSLSGNKIATVAPLNGLTGLYYLFLEQNRVRDLGPLIDMATKDFNGAKRFAPFLNVYLKGNPLPHDQIQRLEAAGPRVDF